MRGLSLRRIARGGVESNNHAVDARARTSFAACDERFLKAGSCGDEHLAAMHETARAGALAVARRTAESTATSRPFERGSNAIARMHATLRLDANP